MRDIRLAVFDLDGTLADIDAPVRAQTLAGLKGLLARGIRLAVCSGKPLAHLCGLLRQAGLPEAIVMGENGAVTQFGIALPPEKHYRLPFDAAAARRLAGIKALIEEKISPVPWFQPNEVVLTPFFSSPAQRLALKALLLDSVKADMGLELFEHADSFDICPAGISKGKALQRLIRELGLAKNQAAAVGDGENDVPLWAEAGFKIQVGSRDLADVDLRAGSILEAIEAIG